MGLVFFRYSDAFIPAIEIRMQYSSAYTAVHEYDCDCIGKLYRIGNEVKKNISDQVFITGYQKHPDIVQDIFCPVLAVGFISSIVFAISSSRSNSWR